MSKSYFCSKLSYGGFQCGESDPTKFTKGRYSECKECKNRYTREYFHSKKYENIDKKVEKIDPKLEIRTVIEDTILRTPLVNGVSVEKAINRNEEIISEVLLNLNEKIEILNAHMKLFSHEIQVLKTENQSLRKEIKLLQK